MTSKAKEAIEIIIETFKKAYELDGIRWKRIRIDKCTQIMEAKEDENKGSFLVDFWDLPGIGYCHIRWYFIGYRWRSETPILELEDTDTPITRSVKISGLNITRPDVYEKYRCLIEVDLTEKKPLLRLLDEFGQHIDAVIKKMQHLSPLSQFFQERFAKYRQKYIQPEFMLRTINLFLFLGRSSTHTSLPNDVIFDIATTYTPTKDLAKRMAGLTAVYGTKKVIKAEDLPEQKPSEPAKTFKL